MGEYLKNSYEDSIVKFSVIIPVYEVEKYIRECLDSVINQTFTRFEVICVNDGSTDNSLGILKEYAENDSRIKIITQENQGQGVARNNAIDAAQGEYLVFVDPDDFLDSEALEVINKSFSDSSADIIQFDYLVCSEDGSNNRQRVFKKRAKRYFNLNLLNDKVFNWQEVGKKSIEGLSLFCWDKAYKTDFIKKYNIKFAPTKNGEDHIFSISANLLANKILYINKSFYHYRTRLKSITNSASIESFCVFKNIELLKQFLITNNLIEEYKFSLDEYVSSVLSWHFANIPQDKTDEYLDKCKEILDPENYELFLKKIKTQYSFWENIFSLKTIYKNGIKVKNLTICGYHISLNVLNKKRILNNVDNFKTICFGGFTIYEIRKYEHLKVKSFFGGLIFTKKIKTSLRFSKEYLLFGVPIYKTIQQNDIRKLYFCRKLVNEIQVPDLFFKIYLKKLKYKYDDVYILNSNSGEVYLFLAYLAKSFIKKNKSQKPLFVATKKYHIDLLNMYYPESDYKCIFIEKLRMKIQSNIWETPKHRYFILFSGNHFEKVEHDIKNSEIGSVHYLTSILKTLKLTEKDFSTPQVIPSIKSQKVLSNAVNKMQLQLNNFIILAPEAMTCEDLPLTFWKKIVSELKSRNFDIYLNITNPKNYINGCKNHKLGFKEAFFLAQTAKAVISLRSGFSEFLLPTGIPNISVYTKFRKRTKNAFSVDKGIEGFSMLKMPFVDKNKVCEINAELYKNEDELVKQVIDSLEIMLNKKECLL